MDEMTNTSSDLPQFDRKFWDGTFRCTRMGKGSLGGKATGLVAMMNMLSGEFARQAFPDMEINVPTMAVIATGFFDQFIEQNHLDRLRFEEISDHRIAHEFQRAPLPVELLGDLRALTMQVKVPLAVRSSSMMEDALGRPFAGVYATKMISNNEHDPDARFHRLVEAVKFIFASTFFKSARNYLKTVGQDAAGEKMAVILQEVVGRRHRDRFYPDVSGVARSYNFYPTAPAQPADGVISLALGLGKTIVDGDRAWTFSPVSPKSRGMYSSVKDLLQNSQIDFWAVNMGKVPVYDPVSELEYLVRLNLAEAEGDDVLNYIASTYDYANDRLVPGTSSQGPRALNFAPLLVYERFPLNEAVKAILRAAEDATKAKVEIEFALTFEPMPGHQTMARLGFLQVRPMVVSSDWLALGEEKLSDPDAVVVSEMVMGNGSDDSIQDIVFVRPERFSPMNTPVIAEQIDRINEDLVGQRRPFLLIGFGRWGSSHFSLGIPVTWSQISGARAIVEAALPEMNVEMSQGSHFFHNLTSFRASYFMVPYGGRFEINWGWLNQQPVIHETELVRHVRPSQPLRVRIDGRNSRGVILHAASAPEASEKTT